MTALIITRRMSACHPLLLENQALAQPPPPSQPWSAPSLTTPATRDATCVSGSSPPRPTSAVTSDMFTWARRNTLESRAFPVLTATRCSQERCEIKCENCDSTFSYQGHMTEHVRTVHEGKKRIYKEVNCQV